MKKAFTLIELLLVIAIIAILAAMLMPALSKAREAAEQSTCRANIHNIGIAMTMLTGDQDGVYPGFVNHTIEDEIDAGQWDALPTRKKWARRTNGGPFYQIVMEGYMDDVDLFDCPTNPNMAWAGYAGGPRIIHETGGPEDPQAGQWYADGSWWPDSRVVGQQEYAYDLGRTAKGSVSGRVIYGDAIHIRHGYGPNFYYSPYNHDGGSNVLYVDGGVEFANKQEVGNMWNAGTNMVDSSVMGTSDRDGWIPNPRMDEDEYRFETYLRNGVGGVTTKDDLRYPSDRDDVYAVEGWSDWGSMAAVDTWAMCGDPDAAAAGGATGRAWAISPVPPEPGNWGQPVRLYKYWVQNDLRRFHEEIGPFANSGEWETHDARLCLWGSWMQWGGMTW
jgi:prepilin-type N-terminal cleavage/methylation domain-containing protein/prepilin-type processing-associated H-X9-DG protein